MTEEFEIEDLPMGGKLIVDDEVLKIRNASLFREVDIPEGFQVVWNYSFNDIIGAANVDNDGRVTIVIEDPRLKEFIQLGKRDKIRAFSVGHEPAVPKEDPNDIQGWERGRWWQVIGPDGKLWCETSDGEEAKRMMREGDKLYKQYVRSESKFVEVRG